MGIYKNNIITVKGLENVLDTVKMLEKVFNAKVKKVFLHNELYCVKFDMEYEDFIRLYNRVKSLNIPIANKL